MAPLTEAFPTLWRSRCLEIMLEGWEQAGDDGVTLKPYLHQRFSNATQFLPSRTLCHLSSGVADLCVLPRPQVTKTQQ